MQEIFTTLAGLRDLTGNAQLSYLEFRKSNLLKEVLEYTYNPHKKYKIEEGKYNKITNYNSETGRELSIADWEEFKKLLDELAELKSAKDTTVLNIKNFIHKFNLDGYQFLEMVLFKDLRLNMGIKKFQKVWNDFCLAPQVQLAQKFEGKLFTNPYYSRKLDGLRTYILDVTAYSRSNKLHKKDPLQHIVDQLATLPEIENYVLDGELIYLEPDGTENFQKAISLARSDDRTTECNNLYLIVFDMIKKENFIEKKPYIPFRDEYNQMQDYFGVTDEELSWYRTSLPNVLIIKQVGEDSVDILREAQSKYHWEGLMVRDGDSSYEYKRTNKLLKIKEMQDTEVKLLDMEIGTGKYADCLGAFILEYKGNILKIGSGFSDEQRVEYWKNKEKYINHYVKVQYFEETQNQNGTLSLRFPVFLCFRNIETKEEFLFLD